MAKNGAKVTYTHTCADTHSSSSGENTSVSALLEAFRDQLSEKDRQIAEKDRQIEVLHRMLSKYMDLNP